MRVRVLLVVAAIVAAATAPVAASDEACTDCVVVEHERRLSSLLATCDHDAVFALIYLRSGEEFQRAFQEPALFEDVAYMTRWNAVFAQYYFDAYDAWHAGTHGAVPPAWQVAFHAADARAVGATGNALLGMNAHIRRDLPFVLASLGIAGRKLDHDRVNDVLSRVPDRLVAELAIRLDPTIDDWDVAWTSGEQGIVNAGIRLWRQEAWRNAERLVAATDAAERARVARSIEDSAAAAALVIAAATSYAPLGTSAARDQHCAQMRQPFASSRTAA